MNPPDSGREAARWLFLLSAATLVAIVAVYAVNTLLAVGVTVLAIAAVGFLLWVIGGRLWDAARHGKPIIRGNWRSGGDDGGD